MSGFFFRRTLASILVLVAPPSAQAQGPIQAAQGQQPPPPTTVPPASLAALTFHAVAPGPPTGALSIAGSTARPNELYLGTIGGLFRSTDGGASWVPVTDGQIRSAPVGAVAVAAEHPDTLYLGTGGPAGDSRWAGDGVYRSVDGGKTWSHQGLAESFSITRMAVHPKDATVAYAAAYGNPGKRGRERGVFRSVDAGKTWTKILYAGDSLGAVDLTVSVAAPNVILASLWAASGTHGGTSLVFRSSDGGDSWVDISGALGTPGPLPGRVSVALSAAEAARGYAMVSGGTGGLYTSTDTGRTWTRVAANGRAKPIFAREDARLYADPKSSQSLTIVSDGRVWNSRDAGATFSASEGLHDVSVLWLSTTGPVRAFGGRSDGFFPLEAKVPLAVPPLLRDRTSAVRWPPAKEAGEWAIAATGETVVAANRRVYRSLNGGASWSRTPVAGLTSAVRAIAISPADSRVVWLWPAAGPIQHTDDGATWKESPPPPLPEHAVPAALAVSPRDARTLYASAERTAVGDVAPYVWRSTDGGVTWTRASDGIPDRATVFALAVDSVREKLVIAGTSLGVAVSFDGGTLWQFVPSALPSLKVTRVDAQPRSLSAIAAGRGAWQLDGLQVLRLMTPEVARAPITLFAPRETTKSGTIEVFYHLAREADSVVVTLSRGSETPLKRFVSAKEDAPGLPSRKQGLSRFTISLAAPADQLLEGQYRVQVTVGKESKSELVTIAPPR